MIETIVAMTEDNLVCRCGNTVDNEGFYPCDAQGNEVTPLPNWGNLVICARCGLIFDQSSYDEKKHTLTIVGSGKYHPLLEFKLGNGVGYLKGYFDSGECLIENTKEQISAFIMASASDNTVITNILDKPEITTLGGFIDKCYNQAFLPELLAVLIPQQMGEVDAIKFVPIPD